MSIVDGGGGRALIQKESAQQDAKTGGLKLYELGKFMFGKDNECLLITHMIAQQGKHYDIRERVPGHLDNTFESRFFI